MELLEKKFKALADKNRLRILKLLEYKKMCVCEFAYIFGVTQPAISKHLKKLKSAGFICDEQDGFWTNYFIKTPENIYGTELLKFLKKVLNDDEIIKQDLIKAKNIDRKNICVCKKEDKIL